MYKGETREERRGKTKKYTTIDSLEFQAGVKKESKYTKNRQLTVGRK